MLDLTRIFEVQLHVEVIIIFDDVFENTLAIPSLIILLHQLRIQAVVLAMPQVFRIQLNVLRALNGIDILGQGLLE